MSDEIKNIYINKNYIVYISDIEPEDTNNLHITSLDWDSTPQELDDFVVILQQTVDVVLMQLGRDANNLTINTKKVNGKN